MSGQLDLELLDRARRRAREVRAAPSPGPGDVVVWFGRYAGRTIADIWNHEADGLPYVCWLGSAFVNDDEIRSAARRFLECTAAELRDRTDGCA